MTDTTSPTAAPQIDAAELDRLVWSIRRTAKNLDVCENTVRQRLIAEKKVQTVELLGRKRVVVASVKRMLGLDHPDQVAA